MGPGIKISLTIENKIESVYLVKGSHMKDTFHPDKGTSY